MHVVLACSFVTSCKVKYKEGDVIVREGDLGNAFYLVTNGHVAVYTLYDDPNKRRHMISLLTGIPCC